MNNLFEPGGKADIVRRLQQLGPDAPALWGRMNVAQMLAHCQAPFEAYFGKMKLKRSLIGMLLGKVAKKRLFADRPWRKSLPTAPEFVIKDERAFEEERAKLMALIDRFAGEGAAVKEVIAHPFFGRLSVQEWGQLGYKHTDHHLKQFGV